MTNTHATAHRSWKDEDLVALVTEDQFRLRGAETTRLDTFIDAAFAFVLTLLVISFDDIPSNGAELIRAAKTVPSFAASFAVLMAIWLQHRVWSRRYGLENRATLRLSLSLIFVVLVYVYPLRAIFEAMFAALTDGYLPSNFDIDGYLTLRWLFIFYSVGFLALCLLMRQLFSAALSHRVALGLNAEEEILTRIDIVSWSISVGFAVVSIALALAMPDGFISLAGYVYFLMILSRPIALRVLRRRRLPAPPDSRA